MRAEMSAKKGTFGSRSVSVAEASTSLLGTGAIPITNSLDAVPVYSGGPLEKEATHIVATLVAVLTITAAVVLPVVLAYIAGTKDAVGAPPGDGITYGILAAASSVLLLGFIWGCCCSWNMRLGLTANLIGKIVPLFLSVALKDDQDNPQHANEVEAKVHQMNVRSSKTANPAKLMARSGVICTDSTMPSKNGPGQVPLRIYRPEAAASSSSALKPAPCLIYLHGGGWVVGGTARNTLYSPHDLICCELAGKIGCVVILPDYRKAPTHKFPASKM